MDFNKSTKDCGVSFVLSQAIKFSAPSRNLIRQKPAIKEMTVNEISNLLGCEVKIIKG